ncbi:MAG: hypothetical protein GC157_07725 [Frankiales bacterium]|nr:hypothetical protein [Frankiales bacterium]
MARRGTAVLAVAATVAALTVSPVGLASAGAAPGVAGWVAFDATDRTKVPDYYGTPNWVNSPQTLADAVVTIQAAPGDAGSGATAIATVDPASGAVTDIDVTDPGSGYTATPSVVITSPGVTPSATAAATADISQGVVSTVTVQETGYGYTHPVASASGGSPTTPVALLASGGVDALQLTDGGSGYTVAPVVSFSLPDVAGGEAPTATATMDANGHVTGIQLLTPGSGYTTAPVVTVTDGPTPNPTAATVTATLKVTQVDVVPDQGTPSVTGGEGYTTAPDVTITDASGTGTGATATADAVVLGAIGSITVDTQGAGYLTPGIKKFVDTLPGLTADKANNLDEYIPIAVPDTTTYPGSDYYEIAVVQYRHVFNSTIPGPGALVRGYVQLSTSVVPGRQIPLTNANLDPAVAPAPILDPHGVQYTAVDPPSYLGPTIVARKDRPVRVLFRNLLPTGEGGNLFLPVDTTIMGSGMGPNAMKLDPVTKVPMDMAMNAGTVTDEVRNPYCGQLPKPADCYSENRSTMHLHGGITPWISDGTPHQWTTPAGETTDYPKGVSVSNVPDMPDPGPGAMTFFYTNQQSARLLFYHDHAWGITRLNIYAGEVAAYLVTDATEDKLTGSGGPLEGMGLGQELVIQDKTFVPDATTVALDDPTWDYSRWGGEGNMWLPHVYMPAQAPASSQGVSSYGRWMYGAWFWPPQTNMKYGPIDNPYYDPSCDPDTADFCQPAQIPGTPNVSTGMEAFNDTPVVNGVAYPTTTLDPKAYRFRILNGSNDRFWNLQWYVADPTTGTLSEVALDPQQVAAAKSDPTVVPQPDLDKSPAGPSWVQIGNESGFLPAPAVIPNQPITWITDPTRFDAGNVDKHALLLAPAERADVVVDFSQYRGKTLILYNDAPAAFPARQANQDYYTDDADLTDTGGAPTTLPGYGPNTRTLMQVRISTATPSVAFDRPNTTNDRMGALEAAFGHHVDPVTGKPAGVFESGQNPIVVGQAAYNSAYGTSFGGGYCDIKALPADKQPAKCDGYARIQQQGGDPFTFDTLDGKKLSIPLTSKAIHDEMNAATFDEYGRMSANMGVEAPGATPLTQNIILYPFVNPATEELWGEATPSSLDVTPIASADDGTQIWKITHNGVDTHPVHFHLFDVQLLNWVTWDNIIIPPDPNELGWKDTVRVSPLEDTYVVARPIVPTIPFGVPTSKRLLNPMMPEGAVGDLNGSFNGQEAGFNNTDVNGNPMTRPIANVMTDFGWEYVWHCHMLSHEEMDMMRPMVLHVPTALPAKPVLTIDKNADPVALTWTDGTPVDYNDPTTWTTHETQAEIGYHLERAPITADGTPGAWTRIQSPLANQVTTTDAAAGSVKWFYRVSAYNESGEVTSDVVTSALPPSAPTALTAQQGNGRVALSWTAPADNGGAPATGYAVQRSTDGTTWTTITADSGSSATSGMATGLTNGTSYVFRVAGVNAAGTGAWSDASALATPDVLPAAPTVSSVLAGDTQVTVTWSAPAPNGGSAVTGYAVERSTDGGLTWSSAVADTGSTALSATVTGLTNGTSYRFRVAAINAMGGGAWSAASAAVRPGANVTVPSAPSAPTGVAGATGTRRITVTWVAPADGGSPITGYALQYTTNGGTSWTTVTSNSGTTAVTRSVTGPRAGTAYRFRVAAINAVGTGAYSGMSAAVTAR